MAYSIGGLIGGLVLAFLLTGLVRWIFRSIGLTDPIILSVFPPVIFLAVATVIGGFGYSRSNGPEFYFAFQKYLLPAVLTGMLYAYLDHRRRRAAERSAET